ncbi:MAG: cob(I)yrinic acid a,c-diamide adenosyltransferase [Candidatus Eremiobacteraeota bacterium]|nr:cob(I)yrinic acid a,c-diamide adenosyltransferase [Candidatus Eremiobacteraeota bacterium]
MAKHTRIYTRTGDDGTTGLVGGQRVKKTALRIEAYGTIDELSTALGLARNALGIAHNASRGGSANDLGHDAGTSDTARELDAWLAWTQDVLFNLGSDLATLPHDRWEGMPLVSAADAQALERAIDRAERDLEPLATFVLPGGCGAGAFLHLARTVARRAERLLVALNDQEPISPDVARYVNRLSDALFVWARWINHALGAPEQRWNPNTTPPE